MMYGLIFIGMILLSLLFPRIPVLRFLPVLNIFPVISEAGLTNHLLELQKELEARLSWRDECRRLYNDANEESRSAQFLSSALSTLRDSEKKVKRARKKLDRALAVLYMNNRGQIASRFAK
jgi:hypothetical protein